MQQNTTLVSNPTMDPKAGESEPRAFHFQSLFGGVSNLGKAVSGKRRNIWRGAEHSLPADLGGHVLGSFSCLINVMGSSCNLEKESCAATSSLALTSFLLPLDCQSPALSAALSLRLGSVLSSNGTAAESWSGKVG